jgi:predicted flavoprotein YhiN
MNEKITINVVDIGFDINEEIHKIFKSEISKETILANKPENKKATEKIETDKKLEKIVQSILINKKITKDELIKEFSDKSLNSIIGLLRNFSIKYHNKELIKQKDYYVFVD